MTRFGTRNLLRRGIKWLVMMPCAYVQAELWWQEPPPWKVQKHEVGGSKPCGRACQALHNTQREDCKEVTIMASDPMDVDSIGGVPIKELHVLGRKLPPQTSARLAPQPNGGANKLERLHVSANSPSPRKSPPSPIPETCRYWLKGTCDRGATCRFLHGGDSMEWE